MPLRLATIALVALTFGQPGFAPQNPLTNPVPALTVRIELNAFTAKLQSYVDFCDRYAKAQYKVDCLSERLTVAAASLGNYGWQREVKWTLRATARNLYAVTTKYADPGAAAITLRGQGTPIVSSRPVRAVAPQNQTRANAAASTVIEEAELTLLRSADTSPANALAFAQVAAIVGSAKVLLRAA